MNRIIHIHADAPLKPVWGAACNGCGVCCLAEPCPVGMLISRKRRGACDALRWDGAAGRYRCGLLAEPETYFRLAWLAPLGLRWARRMISAGSGCDADMTIDAEAPAR